MNELIRKHSDLSNSIIKKGQSYFSSSENSKSDSYLTFMTLCFLGHLTYLGDALVYTGNKKLTHHWDLPTSKLRRPILSLQYVLAAIFR